MTAPLKPRIDFENSPPTEPDRITPGKIFTEKEAEHFAPLNTEFHEPETQTAAEDSIQAVLKPKHHLQHKLFMAGLWLFAGALIAQSIQWLVLAIRQQDWIILASATAAGFIILAGIGSLITERRRLNLLRLRFAEREQASELLLSDASSNKGREFCEKLAQQAGMDHRHPVLQRWQSSLHETHNDSEVLVLYASLVQPVFDARARIEINRHAIESAVMITVSPLALVDMAFIAWRNMQLINRIATLYGIELGYFSRIRLWRMVLWNMAFAGVTELVRESGINWLSQDLTARLSARAAQGIGVGLLTARLGIKTMELCRPLPWMPGDKPRLGDLQRQLIEQLKDPLKK